ncbi:MAG: YgdI/YgdR family lipoprotein [Limisphaerales bacterium]
MKKLITIVFATIVLVGCRSAYDVTLTNGMQFTGVSKPKLDKEKNVFVFKNMSGKTYAIPETRIRTIEPHVKAKQSQFRDQSDTKNFNSSGK